MCGIIGLIGKSSVRETSALDLLSHRGPDGHGLETVSVDGKVIELGHTRLSILDLSPAGAQPMYSRDGRWLLTFNGEIYNHLDLRKKLSGDFRGSSDTETLVESLACFGVQKTLDQLDGMFAFAALDKVEGKLYLVRDPYGVKPVYYHEQGGLAFSSEIKALAAVSGLKIEPDMQGLQTFLTLRFVPSPNTIYKNIMRLQPGHVLIHDVSSCKTDISCYLRQQQELFQGTLSDACDAYRETLERSVKSQLLSDVPVGVLLSGGIDSALVAAMAVQHKPGIKGFTVGFENNVSECEIDDAAETARVLGLDHKYIRVGANNLMNCMKSVARSVEEPLGTTSMLAMWHLSALARRDVTVVLTGQGSDEPWGGYLLYQSELLRNKIPFAGQLGKLAKLAHYIPKLSDSIYRGANMLGIADEAGRFCEARALFTASERMNLVGKSDSGLAVSGIQYWLDFMKGLNISSAERMMRVDTRMNLPDDLLLYGDKITMAVSLEARVPMLDLQLMKFVNSLPLHYRVKLGHRKIVHKEMALRYLPSSIVNRPKKGFQIPFGSLARTDWKDYLHSVLLDRNAKYLSVLNRQGVEQIWQLHQSGNRDCSRQLFALTMLGFCFEGMG
ncbi:asparagine synthase (glutamine-hydrolyzing) [Maridesulfovibrio zosterae]|uniref:asparagine synthase (glutamine-hydrolyzing) n=1 Tax=Maridesulfovibrio zosterae TaxID=82171 RepID=UPI0004266947|nr:asparagine synthase (glutamine-hydrolyzing) [Maridesulfovibrio zosterae]